MMKIPKISKLNASCLIGGLVLVLIGVCKWKVPYFQPPPHAKVPFWDDYHESTGGEPIGVTIEAENELRTIRLDVVDFKGETMTDSLDSIFSRVNENREPARRWSYHLAPEIETNPPITLRLTNVPLGEAFQYVTVLAGNKYEVDGRNLKIVPLSLHNEDRITVKFHAPFYFGTAKSTTPQDVKGELEKAGVTFEREEDSAIYYGKEEILVVRNSEDQLDLVDAYLSSIRYLPRLNFYEEAWYTLLYKLDEFKNGKRPPPAPVFSPIPPDPFGPSPGSEADPFGGGSQLGPDPFGE